MYEKAAELRPGDYELAVAAATAMRQAVRHQDAERWYRKAVALKPAVSSFMVLRFYSSISVCVCVCILHNFYTLDIII